MKREYYASRIDKPLLEKERDLSLLKRQFVVIYNQLEEKGYWQQSFGYQCVDSGYITGEIGRDIKGFIFASLKKDSLWPIDIYVDQYNEEDLFDLMELLHDYVSYPTEGENHTFGNCGWHYYSFDRVTGKIEYRDRVNHILRGYQNGYEISDKGEILNLVESGLETLFSEEVPELTSEEIKIAIERAKLKFLRYGFSSDDRKDAIRTLADILEFLRPKAQKLLLKEDESELFNIANRFGIRHNNTQQKNDYDKNIWYPWMFYYYLGTIHTLLKIIEASGDL